LLQNFFCEFSPLNSVSLSVATSMLQEAESDENFMGQMITGDGTWDYVQDPETNVSIRSGSLLIPRG